MAPATAPALDMAGPRNPTTRRAAASPGDGSADGDAPAAAAPASKQGNGSASSSSSSSRKASALPSKRHPVVAAVEDTVAVVLAVAVLLNFASAAFIEAVAYLLFNWWWPQAWYTVRMFGIRWGWLFPVLFVKAANIRVMVTGPSSELLGLPQPPFASQAFHWFGLRRIWEMFDRRVPRALVILNHLAWVDSFLLSIWLHFNNAVNGDTCWPIYKMFIYVPLGWIAYMSECPFLGYGKDKDLRTLRTSVTDFFKRWFSKFFVFPEGAIFRPVMVEKSHDYARKHGLPLLNHCLLPKTGAFIECGRLLRQQGMKTIVDITLGYPMETCPFAVNPYDLLSLLRRHREPLPIYFHVRKFDMEDVAWEDEKKVSAWLTQRFVEKDQMLDAFYRGQGPLLDGAREESSSWRDILVDLTLWTGVQCAFYWGVSHAAAWGLAHARGLFVAAAAAAAK